MDIMQTHEIFVLPEIIIPAEEEVTELAFATHIEHGLEERDVFIEAGDGKAMRVDGSMPLSHVGQFLYAAETSEQHTDGDFIKSNPLNLTLGEWLAASGYGAYMSNGERGFLDITFKNLVPYGIYSLWYSSLTISDGMTVSNHVPCFADAGHAFVFQAGADGTLLFEREIEALPQSTWEERIVLSLVYHSNVSVPGELGRDMHRQLLAFVPLLMTAD